MAKMSGRESDPLLGFNFRVQIDGPVAAVGYFTECGGLGSEHEIIEHKVLDEKGHEITQKLPGRLKWGDITLKRGITGDLSFWNWRKLAEEGQVKDCRFDGSIFMLDRNYEEAARWDFANGWPSKITGPSVKADSNEVGVEELTIVHEGIKRVK